MTTQPDPTPPPVEHGETSRLSPGAKVGHENREAVRQFFADHIGCTNVECAAALKLSVDAVGRHVATLRREWADPAAGAK
jgi:hypothetical protein